MEMVAFDIVTHRNYRGVLLEFDNGKQSSAINAHGSVRHPNLGFGSMMGFGHFHSNCFPFAPVQYGHIWRMGFSFG